MALPTIPTRHQDSAAHRQRIAESVNGITSFQFDDSRVRTGAEITAGVTPVNYAFEPGVVNRYGENAIPGTTDMTAAIGAAANVVKQNSRYPLRFLGELYLVTDTAISLSVSNPRIHIVGVPEQTIILNQAGASKPTIGLNGAQFWVIDGIVFIGAATFPNYGIDITNFAGFGTISRVVCQTNGWGIHISDTVTITIEDYRYWPSGGSAYGGTSDANGRLGGILADGTGAVNSIYLHNINISNQTTIANGGCCIRADGSGGAGFQDWKIDGLNAENGPVATHRAIWGSKALNWQLVNIFTENSQVLFDKGSRYCHSEIQAGGSGTVALDGTTTACIGMVFANCSGDTFTADAANDGTIQINNVFSGGNNDSSINRVQITTAGTGGVVTPDRLGPFGAIIGKFIASARVAVTYSGTMTVNTALANTFDIVVTDNRAMGVTMTNPTDGQEISIWVKNTSGGAIGVFTWNGTKMTAWTNPATGNQRVLRLRYNSTDAVWKQEFQSPADIPN